MKNLALLLSVLVLSSLGRSASAKPSDAHSGHFEKLAEGRAQKLIGQLNLSESQAKQVNDIRGKMKPVIKEKRQAKRQAFKDLTALMKNDSADEAKIRDAYQKLQTAKSDAEKTQFEMVLELRRILTPEQREKFRGLIAERRKGMREKFMKHMRGEGNAVSEDGDK